MFRVHILSQRPNLRHFGEPLGGAESLLEAVSFRRRRKVKVEEELRMSDGSEFLTAGAAKLKLKTRSNFGMKYDLQLIQDCGLVELCTLSAF